jgi:shikimate kinase
MNSPRVTAPLVSLIGYRGTGKTSVAQHLSTRIGWPWIDADAELELRAGATIKEIFERGGETAFRDLETTIVLELAARDRLILAWGGGVILRERNRIAIRRGLVVWLQADPATIWQRIAADPATSRRRPNLTSGGIQEIEQLLAARTPLYQECADLSVQTVSQTPDQIAEQIVCLLRTHHEATE